ncbi:MAG: hypothetical protein WCW84_13915 [Sulfurimonas sp.]
MKKFLLSLMATISIASAVDTTAINPNVEFCNQLRTVSEAVPKIGMDSYSIVHHKEVTDCTQVSPNEWKQLLALDDVYAFLFNFNAGIDVTSSSAVSRAFGHFVYEVIVDRAKKNNVDTVDGLKNILLQLKSQSEAIQSSVNLEQKDPK